MFTNVHKTPVTLVVNLYALVAALKRTYPPRHDGKNECAAGTDYGIGASRGLQTLILVGVARDRH